MDLYHITYFNISNEYNKNQTVYYECDLIYANNEQLLGIIIDSILGHMCTLRISKSLHIKWFKY